MDNKETGNQDRFEGILTQDDRDLLTNDHGDRPSSTVRDMRYRMRSRIKRGLKDFNYLNHALADDDIEILAENIQDRNVGSLLSNIGFIYRINQYLDNPFGQYSDADRAFGELLEVAVEEADAVEGYLTNAEIEISIERQEPDKSQILENAMDGISYRELQYLQVQGGYVSLLEKIAETDTILQVRRERYPDQAITPQEAERILSRRRPDEADE